MGVINNYVQLLFNYFQISYELQVPKITIMIAVDSCCKCIPFPLRISFYGKVNAT